MRRQVQVLLAWLERADAVSALLGFRMPAPGEDVSLHVATHESQRQALLARPAFDGPPPEVEPLPPEIVDRGEAVLRTLRATNLPPGITDGRFSAGIVDLTRLLSFQKAVALEHISQRVDAATPDDWPALADICLPPASAEEDLSGTFDKDGRGVTITSLNPNLRVSAVRTVTAADEAGSRVIGFTLLFGTPHVHVAEYKGRYFLKDGYHRCYGLLARGITRAPVILERARSFLDVHGGGSTLVPQEYLLGTHPPRLTDFHDPAVSATVSQQALRKAIRIRAEEFVVNV